MRKSEILLKPVMTLKARVNFVKTLKEDGGISYGLTYRGKKGQRIATIPIGYADGYTRLLSNVGEVLIGGIKSKVVGTICMDQCMLDVSMIEGIEVGTEAILFGTNGKEEINVSEVAKRCGKIPYELLCSIGRRVPRVYLRSGKVVKETNYLD